eukprot:CAMPEP_0204827412 /NCGR_PEP_ID=MMETSP1346-20131115/4880_1 /ASSEMBLY_ACC=CAM_ASM_000771 /TAXON_ID=215587 /ORGANISM="Aplanochytrium stocchinoi, Strain GSBS06" /LENGTH=189 /DNA_ID=CAMNT_0051955827 /DNA_START=98 /DNA_END=664 /DNA_ORIENTATION=+
MYEKQKYIHEQQRLQLCGLHTVNNLLQLSTESSEDRAATKKELDEIADDLALAEQNLYAEDPLIPRVASLSLTGLLRSRHRTPVFGNYSIEVLETALQRRGFKTSWIDVDKHLNCFESVTDDHETEIVESEEEEGKIIGYIVNVKSRNLLSRLFFGRHWYAVRKQRKDESLASDSHEQDVNVNSSDQEW